MLIITKDSPKSCLQAEITASAIEKMVGRYTLFDEFYTAHIEGDGCTFHFGVYPILHRQGVAKKNRFVSVHYSRRHSSQQPEIELVNTDWDDYIKEQVELIAPCCFANIMFTPGKRNEIYHAEGSKNLDAYVKANFKRGDTAQSAVRYMFKELMDEMILQSK